ncbi:helix-turn-helix transcriptional regulator [Lacunimicrobium album]
MSNGVQELRMIDAEALAKILNVDVKSVRRMSDDGRLPSPVRLGRMCRWREDVITKWVEDGCPTQQKGVQQ